MFQVRSMWCRGAAAAAGPFPPAASPFLPPPLPTRALPPLATRSSPLVASNPSCMPSVGHALGSQPCSAALCHTLLHPSPHLHCCRCCCCPPLFKPRQNTLVKFSADGTQLDVWGSTGEGNGECRSGWAVTTVAGCMGQPVNKRRVANNRSCCACDLASASGGPCGRGYVAVWMGAATACADCPASLLLQAITTGYPTWHSAVACCCRRPGEWRSAAAAPHGQQSGVLGSGQRAATVHGDPQMSPCSLGLVRAACWQLCHPSAAASLASAIHSATPHVRRATTGCKC